MGIKARHYYWLVGSGVAAGVILALSFVLTTLREPGNPSFSRPPEQLLSAEPETQASEIVGWPSPSLAQIKFVGPRENIPTNAPSAYGFWSFAVPVSGVLSRSGQPLMEEFEWLADNGWRSVVNLRVDGERDEVGDDTKLAGWSNLGLKYLPLPIIDGHPPTQEQAEQFLTFVTDSDNQPVHVHCRGGIGRTGTMVALYRYSVQGWPMDQAVQESRAFKDGVSAVQETWLVRWAQQNPPGSYR